MSRAKAPLSPSLMSFRTSSAYFGVPYGAIPMTLYSPSLTSNPRNAVKTL